MSAKEKSHTFKSNRIVEKTQAVRNVLRYFQCRKSKMPTEEIEPIYKRDKVL